MLIFKFQARFKRTRKNSSKHEGGSVLRKREYLRFVCRHFFSISLKLKLQNSIAKCLTKTAKIVITLTFHCKRFSLKKIEDPIKKLIKIFEFNVWLLKRWLMEREMDFSPVLPARKKKKKSKKDRRKRNKSIISIVSSPDEEKKVQRCVLRGEN